MSSSSSNQTVERVCLNLRVSKSVKEAYESVVAEKHGRKRPYTGTELERELRFALGEGTISDLYDAVSDLGDAFGEAPREKKNLSTPNDETAVVGYRVSESVRRGIMSLASGTTCSNPGEFVERIMQSYAAGESVDERLINLTDRIKQATDHKFNDDLSAVEKRTKAIAAELDLVEFTLDDFDEAVEAVPNISPSRHVRQQYLSRVLDELDATWIDRDYEADIFTTRDQPPEAERDHRNKPYLLMDNSDKRLAIKTGFIKSSNNVYTESEAMGALQNKPQPSEVRKLMRQIGETYGFGYMAGNERRKKNADDVLGIERNEALSSPKHKDLARVLMDTDGTQWVQEAAESLPDNVESYQNSTAVIKNKIVHATIDEDLHGVDASDFFDAITDEQVARVRQCFAESNEEPGSTPVEGRGETAETTVRQPDNEQIEASSSVTPARTDGGETDE